MYLLPLAGVLLGRREDPDPTFPVVILGVENYLQGYYVSSDSNCDGSNSSYSGNSSNSSDRSDSTWRGNYLQGYYVKQRSRSNHYSVDLVGPLKQSQIRPNVTFEKEPYPI